MPSPPCRRGLVALALLWLAWASPAQAADTSPPLALAQAAAVRGSAGVLLQLDASYPQPDALQIPMQIQLVVRELGQGTHFVRYELPAAAVEADVPELAGGLDADNVWLLLNTTTPSPDARLLAVRPGRLEVLLPADFPTGAAEAQLFFIYFGDPVFSNPLPFDVPVGAQP